MLLSGVYTAIITPFREDDHEIDWPAYERLLQLQIDAGIDGVVPCGTTGESPTLSHSEHEQLVARTVAYIKSRKPEMLVIAGTGSNSTQEAIDLSRAARRDGADLVLSVNPYYNKPTQEGLYRHFCSIADEAGIPVMLYNIPGRSVVSLQLDTIRRLAEHPGIIGIKEATGDMTFMSEVASIDPEAFSVLSGDDALTLPLLAAGGQGVISVFSNIFPADLMSMYHLWKAGNFAEALNLHRRMLPLFRALFIETNPIPVKYAMAKKGLISDTLRLPMTGLGPSGATILDAAIASYPGAS